MSFCFYLYPQLSEGFVFTALIYIDFQHNYFATLIHTTINLLICVFIFINPIDCLSPLIHKISCLTPHINTIFELYVIIKEMNDNGYDILESFTLKVLFYCCTSLLITLLPSYFISVFILLNVQIILLIYHIDLLIYYKLKIFYIFFVFIFIFILTLVVNY